MINKSTLKKGVIGFGLFILLWSVIAPYSLQYWFVYLITDDQHRKALTRTGTPIVRLDYSIPENMALLHSDPRNKQGRVMHTSPIFLDVLEPMTDKRPKLATVERQIDKLMKQGFKINGVYNVSWMGEKSPIAVALFHGRYDVAYALLSRGADYMDGYTPISYSNCPEVEPKNLASIYTKIYSSLNRTYQNDPQRKWLTKVINWVESDLDKHPEKKAKYYRDFDITPCQYVDKPHHHRLPLPANGSDS
ncbi:hypothetical protein [Vibrio sp. MA40-2]|uniref:hypothetical protein n=1 Tax=Vibrio sp. MA40-2 TaxID=3391828 RepID=UPI0039A6CAA0